MGEISSSISFRPSSINHLKESFCIINKSGMSRTLGIFANESLEFWTADNKPPKKINNNYPKGRVY